MRKTTISTKDLNCKNPTSCLFKCTLVCTEPACPVTAALSRWFLEPTNLLQFWPWGTPSRDQRVARSSCQCGPRIVSWGGWQRCKLWCSVYHSPLHKRACSRNLAKSTWLWVTRDPVRASMSPRIGSSTSVASSWRRVPDSVLYLCLSDALGSSFWRK